MRADVRALGAKEGNDMSDQSEAKTKTVGFLPIEKVQTLPGWDDYLDKSIKLAALKTETQKAKNTVRQALKLRLNENDDIDFATEGEKIRVFRVFRRLHQGRRTLARISHTTEDWAPGKPILSDAGPAPRVFVAPKALYVGNFLDLRGSVSCARNDRAGAARVTPGRRGRWQRLRAGLRRVPNLARPGRPMPWRS